MTPRRGANDYMTKPIVASELQARVSAGLRTIAVQGDLRGRLREAESIAAQTRPLRELIPICVYCHRVRDRAQQWSSLEEFLRTQINVKFTHGFCPSCYTDHVKPDLDADSE